MLNISAAPILCARGRLAYNQNVHSDDAGEIEVFKSLDADGATAPETLRHQEPCRQDNLERGGSVTTRPGTSTEGDVRPQCARRTKLSGTKTDGALEPNPFGSVATLV